MDVDILTAEILCLFVCKGKWQRGSYNVNTFNHFFPLFNNSFFLSCHLLVSRTLYMSQKNTVDTCLKHFLERKCKIAKYDTDTLKTVGLRITQDGLFW